MLIPGSLVNIIHLGPAGLPGNRLIMGYDGIGDPIHGPLNGPPAHGYAQHGRAKLLHGAATASLTARQLPDERRQLRPIAVAVLRRHLGFEAAAAPRTTRF